MNKLFAFLICATLVIVPSRLVKGNDINVIVVAYANPAYSPDGPVMWNSLVATAAMSNRNFQIRAILNPDTGPGSTPAIQQERFMQYFGLNGEGLASQFRNEGGEIVGYVSTLRGERDLPSVLQDIDDYLGGVFAGNIDGIFMDDFYDSPSDINYYQTIYAHIQSNYPNALILGNAGNTGLINQLDASQTASLISPLDVLVSHEMTRDSYTNEYVELEEADSYHESRFAHLIHDSGTWNLSLLNLMASRDTGWVYATPDNADNPWDNFDSKFWNSLVDDLIAANTPPTPIVPFGRKLLDGVVISGTLGMFISATTLSTKLIRPPPLIHLNKKWICF